MGLWAILLQFTNYESGPGLLEAVTFWLWWSLWNEQEGVSERGDVSITRNSLTIGSFMGTLSRSQGLNGPFITKFKARNSLWLLPRSEIHWKETAKGKWACQLPMLYLLPRKRLSNFRVLSMVPFTLALHSLKHLEQLPLLLTWSVQQSLQMLHLWLPKQLLSSSEIQLFAKYLWGLGKCGHLWLSAKGSDTEAQSINYK